MGGVGMEVCRRKTKELLNKILSTESEQQNQIDLLEEVRNLYRLAGVLSRLQAEIGEHLYCPCACKDRGAWCRIEGLIRAFSNQQAVCAEIRRLLELDETK